MSKRITKLQRSVLGLALFNAIQSTIKSRITVTQEFLFSQFCGCGLDPLTWEMLDSVLELLEKRGQIVRADNVISWNPRRSTKRKVSR